jgi:hypothetical protein
VSHAEPKSGARPEIVPRMNQERAITIIGSTNSPQNESRESHHNHRVHRGNPRGKVGHAGSVTVFIHGALGCSARNWSVEHPQRPSETEVVVLRTNRNRLLILCTGNRSGSPWQFNCQSVTAPTGPLSSAQQHPSLCTCTYLSVRTCPTRS